MFKRLLMIAIVLAATAWAIQSLQEKRQSEIEALSSRTMPPVAVMALDVEADFWRQTLFAVGSLVAENGVEVVAALPGSIIDIDFESGQLARRGDVLAKMDVGISIAELEGLKATRELRGLQFKRAEKLFHEKQVSQSDFEAARAALDEARAAVGAKQAFIERKRIYAPFDGVLGIRKVNLGDYLEPGDPVVSLHALSPIHVDYALPEQNLGRLSLGQRVEVTVPAYPDEVFVGSISAFDSEIDPRTRNIRIRATLENAERRLRPGMFAEVSTIETEARPVLCLPQTAVTYSPYGSTVFVVVDQDGTTTVEKRTIETGEIRAGLVEIVKGLELGQRVVAVGQNKMRSGMQVKVIETAEPLAETVSR